MSEFATYSSIDQDLSAHSKENPNIINYNNGINSYIKSRSNAYSLPLEIQNHKSYTTDYDDKYNKNKQIHFKDNKSEYVHSNIDKINITILVGLSLIIRLWKISNPKEVVFDEVHFGGFANQYLKRTFFMDVHPPLAKMMFALVAFLSGYKGDFSFEEIGLSYEDGVPYVTMRLYSALCGILVVPIGYYIIKGLKFSRYAAFLGALFIIFENALITQSRLILLDSQLILFAAYTLLSWVNFIANKESPWTKSWWFWLASTGVGLGLTFSVKWVGLFIIATIGLATIKDLWDILGNVDNSMYQVVKHFMARALCLIIVPLSLYAFFFKIHLAIVSKKGGGTTFMSAEFQASFDDNKPKPTYYDVAYSSRVYIRHINTNGGFLHSHDSTYPTGSKQQQITLYGFADSNSEWLIIPQRDTENYKFGQYIKDGDTVRLQHVPTAKRLHSHDHRPPMSEEEYQNEVSGYGGPGTLDPHDNWVIEIEKGRNKESREYVKTFDTVFRLRHKNTGCYLFSHPVSLPEWGFEQQEVTCGTDVLRKNTLWRIEMNNNSEFNEKDHKQVLPRKLSFLEKLVELNIVMFKVNSELTGSHPFESRPPQWPFLKRGISFWGASESNTGSIYLLGNPFVWYLGTISILIYMVYFFLFEIVKQTKIGLSKKIRKALFKLAYPGGLIFTAWAAHYFPFFLMGRQLYIHHYLPSLYFSILMSAIIIDTIFIARFRQPTTKLIIIIFFSFIAIYYYKKFSPLAYGTDMKQSKCFTLKLKDTWDIDCSKFI
ncbi:PMT-domain-containing protein [Piromyces finnis]|uniref:Dolichyl-phosphate-mannose--protein mannosyltransferase n=1 Tax=Piromyces finnis TaxID=1754191 RepID=A0A1Y1V0M2_9FUNG|nr:PMT-domain-containing protein [Piromyces finnis]|eukprot:ORX43409.1 PMT-domain-containing protein [Piromyces finnis]